MVLEYDEREGAVEEIVTKGAESKAEMIKRITAELEKTTEEEKNRAAGRIKNGTLNAGGLFTIMAGLFVYALIREAWIPAAALLLGMAATAAALILADLAIKLLAALDHALSLLPRTLALLAEEGKVRTKPEQRPERETLRAAAQFGPTEDES